MAVSVPIERPITTNELAGLPDDGNRYELVGGILEVSPSPTRTHQLISGNLYWLFRNHFSVTQDGEVISAPIDLHLGIHDLVQPDMIVLSRERALENADFDRVNVSPDLVIEIHSSTSRGRDLIAKSALYARVGIPEYWVVDPEHSTISLGVLADGRYVYPESPDGLARSQRFPGLVLDPKEVFRMTDWDQTDLPPAS